MDFLHGLKPRFGYWIFWGIVAIAGFVLLAQHTDHVIRYLPLLILAACPLMHLFHSHGGHAHHDQTREGGRKDGETAPRTFRFPLK